VTAPGPLRALSALGSGLRMLARERSLWVWSALPVLVNGVAIVGAVVLFVAWLLDPVSTAISEWLAVADPASWYAWLWVGPIRLLAWLARFVVLALFAVALYLAFVLLGGVLASPFLDVLSRRVEALCTGEVRDVAGPGVGGALRASLRCVAWEARRVGAFIALQTVILALGLVPGLQPFAALAALGLAAAFLPLDYTGYLLDRRGASFRVRRRWIWQHRGPALLFGLAALATFAVPLLNFLCLPWLVTAGTLLALELGPPSVEAESLPEQPLG
jgi:CysZ protein